MSDNCAVNTPTLDNSTRFRRHHRYILVLCVAAVIVALGLQVNSEGRLALLGFPELSLPGVCVWRSYFGFNCPGCGLTRSVVLTAHGDFAAAFALHRIGPVIFLAVLLQFPYRIGALFRKTDYPYGKWIDWGTVIVFALLLLANWVWNLAGRSG